MVNGDRDRETELQQWLLARFPEGGSVADRVQRNRRRRLAAFAVAYVTVQVLLHRFDGRHLWRVPSPHPAWVDVVGVAAALLILAGILLALRPGLRKGEASAALRALTAAQRRELGREIRGQRPLQPGDEPALRRLASTWVTERSAALAAIGAVIGLIPAALAGRGGTAGLVRVAVMVAFAATAAFVLARAAAGASYLDDDPSVRADDERATTTR